MVECECLNFFLFSLTNLGQLILHVGLGRLDFLDVGLKSCCCSLDLLLFVSSCLLQERLHQGSEGRRVALLLLCFAYVDV